MAATWLVREMMPGGLPVLLPSRLTESTVWSEDRIWPGFGLIVGGARGEVPLDGGGVHLHSLHRHIADLVLGLKRLVLHNRDGAAQGEKIGKKLLVYLIT